MQRSQLPTRHNWSRDEIAAIYHKPLLSLVYDAQTIHRQTFADGTIQMSTLLSIKTGSCPEDCKYCPQSAHYTTPVQKEPLLDVDSVLQAAQKAKETGSTRFCMGAAWREVRDGENFERVLKMVEGVKSLGMESCVTLGMVNEGQAQKLKDAGLDYYNHNLDTSREHYGNIITTRTYDDRLRTLKNVRGAGINVCCGGIIGMGETVDDRIGLLQELANQTPHPESVPINALVPVEGTPLGEIERADGIEMARMIATARIIMPNSVVRLSAGRTSLSDEAHALCFMAGANSIFAGERLLTTPLPGTDVDKVLLDKLGLKAQESNAQTV
jgi:biotin synthase